MTVAAETKVCTQCKAEKELWEFHNDRKYPDGKTNQCAECRNSPRRNHGKEKIFAAQVIENGTKLCFACDELLPLGNFHRNSSTRSGYEGRCKQCKKEYLKMRLATDGEYRAKVRRRKREQSTVSRRKKGIPPRIFKSRSGEKGYRVPSKPIAFAVVDFIARHEGETLSTVAARVYGTPETSALQRRLGLIPDTDGVKRTTMNHTTAVKIIEAIYRDPHEFDV